MEKILVGGMIGVSLHVLVNLFFYFKNDYPLFSIVNISVVIGSSLLLVIILLYLVVRKKIKKSDPSS